MKKRLLKFTLLAAGILSTVFAVLFCLSLNGEKSTVGTVYAAEHTNHCECGGTKNGVGDHVCSTAAPTWVGVGSQADITALDGIGEAPSAPREYWIYLKNDITLSASLTFYDNGAQQVTLHLCLNGYTLKGANNSRVMHGINGVCHLTICDCSAAQTGTIQCQGAIGSASSTLQGHGILLHKAGSTLKFYGGTLRDGYAKNNYGGNVAVNGSSFTMYGGAILNGQSHEKDLVSTGTNAATYLGGNVGLVGSSTFTMYDGLIAGGSTYNGSGGNVGLGNTSKFFMYGGTIKDGYSYGSYGGNVGLSAAGTQFTMEGGLISGGSAEKVGTGGGFGGNVGVGGTFTMNGGTVKDGFANGSSGGNVSMWNANGRFIMNGGLITGGTATDGRAGGVAAFYQATKDGVITLNGGEISGNIVGVECQTGTLYVSGAPVVKDNDTYNISCTVKSIVTAPLTGGKLRFSEAKYFCYSDTDYSRYIQCDTSTLITSYDATEGAHYFVTPLFIGDLANRKIDIYIIGGQSNASGTSTFASATERDSNIYENMFFYELRYDTTGTLQRDKSGYGPVHEGLGYADDRIGPELGMAQIMNDLYAGDDKKALIIKTAYGATATTFHQNDDGVLIDANGNFLSASEDERQTQRGTWYPDQLQSAAVKALGDNRPTGFQLREGIKMVTNVYHELIAKGYKAENISFKSIIWMQGEADRLYPEAYKEIFPLTVEEYRAAISDLTGDDYSDLRLVIGEICSTFSNATPSSCANAGDFIAMQNELPEVISNTAVIPTKGFAQNKIVNGASVECGTDNCHWTYDDMVEIGRMFAEASLEVPFPAHEHCSCGGSKEGKSGHTCEDVTWIPLRSAEEFTSLRGVGGTTLPSGETREYYAYLENDVDLYAVMGIAKGVSLHLCLNGYDVTYGGSTKCLDVAEGATLEVVDCKTGEVRTADYSYNELPHIHCECGGVRNGVGDHTCGTTEITWTKVTTSSGISGLPGIGGTALGSDTTPEYYIYLGNDVTLSKSMTLVDGVTLHICLNGHTMTGAASSRLFFVNNGAHVTVCDCSEEETGLMKTTGTLGSSTSTLQGHAFCLYSSSSTTGKTQSLKLYGGTISGGKTAANFGGNIALGNVGELYMYGGTITGGSAMMDASNASGSGGNVGINGTNAVFTMYAGTISDGYAGSYGGNISGGTGKVTILGGTITGGNAKWGGNLAFASTTGKDVLIQDTVITNGTARSGYGGNIGAYDGTNITLKGDTLVSGGTATTFGGNIAMRGATKEATFTISEGVTIEKGSTKTTTGCFGGNIGISGKSNFVMTGGTVREGNSYCGGNIALGNGATNSTGDGKVTISGGLIENGQATANGWDVQNQTTGTGLVTLSGNIVVKNTLSHTGGGSINVGELNQKLIINGGTYDCQAIMCTCGELDIADGYFNAVLNNYTYTYQFVVSGGYFVTAPAANRIKAGYAAKPVTETKDNITYKYHIVEGCIITATSRSEDSDEPVATVTGGGILEPHKRLTLTAPEVVPGYVFVGWYKEYPNSRVSINLSYEVTEETEDTTFIAVYKSTGTALRLTVYSDDYSIQNGSEEPQNHDYTFTYLCQPGDEITLTYNGPDFLSWMTDRNKVISRDVSYTFKIYTDTVIYGRSYYEPADPITTVVFYSDTNQVIKSFISVMPLDETNLPEIPLHPGFTGGRWDKTLDEINAGIADLGTKLVEIHAVDYEGASLYEALEPGTEPKIEMTERLVTGQGDTTMKTLTFGATRSVPDGYQLIEQGFLLTTMANASSAAEAKEILFLGSDKATKFVSPNTNADSLTLLNIRNIDTGVTLYAVGYLVYLKDGEITTIYTNVNTGTVSGITE